MSSASPILSSLGELCIDKFLKQYWQRQAVFLPQALADFRSPITPDELAGLALEDVIESRLIIHSKSAPWQLKTGPFNEQDFAELPTEQWSLLVQAVDHWVPEVADLLDRFRFIPNWRLDDVMVSYAPKGGSVGPHFDYYDVFLVQGAGTREWHIGQHCDSNSERLEGTDLNILRDFTPEATYTAQPGDVLYIPPGVAHWGTALDDDCMTFSIGFRAPSEADIIDEFGQHIVAELTNDNRYKDQNASATNTPGAIDITVIEQLQKQLVSHLTTANIAQWFGRYMTEAKYPLECTPVAADASSWQQWLDQEVAVERELAARFSYFDDAQSTTLFVDGQAYPCNTPLAHTLCNQRHWSIVTLDALCPNDADKSLLLQLIKDHKIVIDDGSDEQDSP
ncbi:cupin domain-containing protein [Gilvimarinus polysaccharolyticus]|uniref:cupin domain-containing protein n=1 Tax=Gilvimarinus polysaccharolyticus TaxID=863921 RepID=UPI0006731980|nr:cupin domain-containing protein [Gilvimarinus polysaccharolyticus]